MSISVFTLDIAWSPGDALEGAYFGFNGGLGLGFSWGFFFLGHI
jgi:hypothetical protein